ncbi:Ndufs6, NADH-ubiquinone oxidoreductase complex I 13kd subunit [Serpula lacrymans var. lacrymans S7.3]|uniref:Ndufs6, NADH-ubiquinone oxidoreductase complex I 13kd subunit n=2 Tax=Serpula lacrymans var. lacrymans TaxID=341189 RepID=F8PUD9_SERL3|nr:Ndufs6, NADH-ubiquinone oxidoreductase complex I 13kd subunit [Serpula lacrymans var. lacrymans S7.9]EGN99659.1 Ndufs6, NADH-ubiquinone oxidoreductase complex I 13kd subunit [Serpula lacrymans var. lacrymans S7.3]EGO25222.1 Ndufs6, NADH-ubiquinone oxidoreductase complex I 13kd subunit [Serpula lacrymans var. lacrymans S7.9]
MFSSNLTRRLTKVRFPAFSSPSYQSSALSTLLPSAPPAESPKTPSTTVAKNPLTVPLVGPRFEQTAMELQPNPVNAMDLINQEPIRLVDGRKAVCDGGGGPLGHPKIYINLDRPGPRPCGYCGLQFEQAPHHGHGH